jgi:two-component system OmpR family sensor kinase
VVDDGPGIPAALLPDVFDRFARADTSRSRAAGSTGLGLSIVDAVVQAHGGRVEVDSGPGRTVFTVTLPARAPAAGSGLAPGTSGKRPV